MLRALRMDESIGFVFLVSFSSKEVDLIILVRRGTSISSSNYRTSGRLSSSISEDFSKLSLASDVAAAISMGFVNRYYFEKKGWRLLVKR
jgi:hypothetical protein